MRIPCPLCGTRDRREFTYYGSDDYLNRPAPDIAADTAVEAWEDHLHLRTNPAGKTHDLWYHEAGCAQWLRVHRNTVTHEVYGAELVAALKGGAK